MKIRVVAIIVDTARLTLYKEDGTTVEIPQGDPRVRRIVDEVLPIVELGFVAEVSVEESSNSYRQFEEETGGWARFYRTAKKNLAGLFGIPVDDADITPVPPVQAGVMPNQGASAAYAQVTEDEATKGPSPVTAVSDKAAAVEAIIQGAEPAASDSFRDEDQKEDETVVAVVKNAEGNDTIIPGMEQLRGQLRHAAKLGSTTALETFLARIAKVIDRRSHSIEDLLRFMERGDLPVAEDGSIIAYKMLYRRDGGYYVDCHTKKVEQRIGSYVCVSEDLVDRNRRNECSNGLHVARRAYLGSFSGDVCVLVKVAPEDVVTVPHNDPNKVRVCGYHILFELDAESFRKVKGNKPMTDSEAAQRMLGRAITGDHTPVTEEVRITQQLGGGIIFTPMKGQDVVLEGDKATQPKRELKAEAIEPPAKPGERNLDAPAVDPKQVAGQATRAPVETARPAPVSPARPAESSRQTKVRQLFMAMEATQDAQERYKLANDIIAFKKQAKVSYAILGLNDRQVTELLSVAENEPVTPVTVAPREPRRPVRTPPPAKATRTAPDPLVAAAGALQTAGEALGEVKSNRQTRALQFYKIVTTSTDPVHRREAAHQLLDFKRTAKVGWERLGLKADVATELQAIVDAPVQAPPVPAREYSDTHAGRARQLFDEGKFGPLWDYKQRAKKGWAVLDFNPDEVKIILANKP